MSPEPNSIKLYDKNFTDLKNSNKNMVATTKGESAAINMLAVEASEEPKQTNTTAANVDGGGSDGLLKPPIGKRERRNVSPCLNETFPDPMSPSSSSSTSQATSANDATFEPTVEMMVNDFDDEQTLNEEEALAAMESQDPVEEINTLQEESEMPIEELLAKYQALPSMPFIEPPRKKSKKSSNKKKHKSKPKPAINSSEGGLEDLGCSEVGGVQTETATDDAGVLDDNHNESADEKDVPEEEDETLGLKHPDAHQAEVDYPEKKTVGNDIHKVRRTHLLDLYPVGTFDNVAVVKEAVSGNDKDIPLETLYGVEDEEDEEIEDEDDEDYKKKVMIGASYQATIPHGLSQYGDILPYENEDKLIWEPIQVSEREVEEYLLKIRDIKSNQGGEEETLEATDNVSSAVSKTNGHRGTNMDNMENNSLLANGDRTNVSSGTGLQNNGNVDFEGQAAVVKDNEQALHLLVQCGYDFKEALRRKRLNALPLNDCMSLWSEEECQKFEEGIQKYGKDFLKIRQNQVRTRTMRELVQFYYLWKKSERRDHNFANADTVDHMDIYLNEDNEYGSNPASVTTPIGSPVGNTTTTTSATRRNSNNSQKNVSIMSNAGTITNNSCTPLLISLDKVGPSSQQQKRRASNNIVMHTEASNLDNALSTTSMQATSSSVSPSK